MFLEPFVLIELQNYSTIIYWANLALFLCESTEEKGIIWVLLESLVFVQQIDFMLP